MPWGFDIDNKHGYIALSTTFLSAAASIELLDGPSKRLCTPLDDEVDVQPVLNEGGNWAGSVQVAVHELAFAR
jgi:hypothetical protein